MIPGPRNINAASRRVERSLTIISFSRGYWACCWRAMKTAPSRRKPWSAKADTGRSRLPSALFTGRGDPIRRESESARGPRGGNRKSTLQLNTANRVGRLPIANDSNLKVLDSNLSIVCNTRFQVPRSKLSSGFQITAYFEVRGVRKTICDTADLF